MSQLDQKISIPWWLSLIIFMEVWPMFVGPYLALTDPTFFGTPESTTTILGDWIYTARNFAVGVAFIIAYYLKSAPMLFILIFVRLFTDLIDGPAFWFFRDPISEFFFIFLFLFGYYIPGIIALIYLWKQIQKN